MGIVHKSDLLDGKKVGQRVEQQTSNTLFNSCLADISSYTANVTTALHSISKAKKASTDPISTVRAELLSLDITQVMAEFASAKTRLQTSYACLSHARQTREMEH